MLAVKNIIKAKKKSLLIALLYFFTFTIAYAQTSSSSTHFTGTIKGIVVDSVTKTVLANVTVEIHQLGKSLPFKSTFSKENGFFKLTGLQPKQYLLILTYVGYKAKIVQVPAFTSSSINLGTISLVSAITQLKEVKVVAQKPIVEQDIDKLTYNVDADPESKTATAFEILRKVPLLTIDADDNLQLNGNGNYRILINGKSSSLFFRNQSDAFKNLSATAIRTIEVITVPPSKYEAQGVGGIINIITYKKSIGGYNGGINLQASRPRGVSTNGNIAASLRKISFSGNFGYNTNTSPTNSSTFSRQDKISQSRLEQTGASNSNYRSLNMGSEVTFELNSYNLITASYSLNNGNSVSNFNQDVVLLNADYEPAELYRSLNRSSSKQYGNDFSVDYQRSFKKNGAQQLTLSYYWSKSTDRSMSDFSVQPLMNYKSQASTTSDDDGFNEQIFKADYVQPIKKHSVELGVNSIFRKNSSDYFYENQDTLTGAFVFDSSLSNVFHYTENIYAAYSSLNLKMGKWGLKLGARVEQAKIDAHFVSSRTFAVQNYLNLIPNITLSRQLKGISMIKLSYTQRINRPNLDYLNPYVDLTDLWNISYGNPSLQPAVGHVFSVAYNTFIKKSSLNISFFHQFTNNSIQEFTTLGADTVARTTFGNIGKNKSYNLSLSGNTILFKKLSINLNGKANYIQYTSIINGKPHTNEGFTYNASGSANLRLKGWGVSGNMSYTAPNILVQGRTSSYISNGITVNKYFFKNNKANITFSVTSPFRKLRRSFMEINDPAFYMLRESYSVIRRYNLSFNYRFVKVQ